MINMIPERMDSSRPFDNALCVFKMKDSDVMFLGYMPEFPRKKVKVFCKNEFLEIDCIDTYQYVLNEKGGCIFIKPQKS